MKRINFFTKKMLLFVCAFVALTTYAQQETNREALERISIEQKSAWKKAEERAKKYAEENKIAQRVVRENGTIIELADVQDGLPVYFITDNIGAAATTRASALWTNSNFGGGLTGAGFDKIAIWDGGRVRTTHQEFNNTGSSRITLAGDNSSNSDHATHVAGTIIAGGVQSNAKGMAFEAGLKSYDWNYVESEMATAANQNYVISNHSWGTITGWRYDEDTQQWLWYGNTNISTNEDYNFGYYDYRAHDWDEICYNAPYFLIVKSAGNDRGEGPSNAGTGGLPEKDGGADGYDCISHAGIAKNVLTVGAVYKVANYTSPSSVTMSSFSCWGPADDGRIKPDIVAAGVNVYSSTASSNNSYSSYNGTSMATPNATGSLVLLHQYHQQLHGSTMRSATIKALAIHTAEECGPNEGPDYMYGWGLLNVEKGAQLIKDKTAKNTISELTLQNNQTFERTIAVQPGEPLRATICWTDPKGTVHTAALNNRTPVLVNDLDIKITKESSTYYPYKLNPNNPSAAATKNSTNDVDNVEHIYIANPTAGNYKITVTHKGSLQGGSQAFSLITSYNTSSASSDANLSNLTVNPGTLTPSFSPNTTNYTVNVANNVSSVTITATKNHPNATVSGAGVKSLNVGSNTFPIVVTAENGVTTKTYTVVVNRGAPAGSATVILTANNVWGDGTGYAMLLDADATIYPEIPTGNFQGSIPSTIFNQFEYKIPENATSSFNSPAVTNGSVSINIPAGTYDYCVTNPDPNYSNVWIAGGEYGRQDNYVFENGHTYSFTVVRNGNNDQVLLEITPYSSVSNFPWAEGFETSNSLDHWSIVDSDGNPSWSRTNTLTHASSYSIYHNWGEEGANQVGWLVSPAIVLPSTGSYELKFWSINNAYNDYFKNSVLVSTTSPNPTTGNFTEIWSPTTVTGNWTETTLGLSAYAGQTIYIAFKYEGTYAHAWHLDDVSVSLAPVSNDATLSNLTVNPGTLTPNFNSNTTSYTVDVANSVSNITITGTANHSGATVVGNGNKSLNVGTNTFNIIVTAENGSTTKTYTVTVNRAAAASSDATLSNLTVSSGTLTPSFNSNTTSYTVDVANSVSNITITGTANHSGATVAGNGNKSLNVGANTFNIVVTAENGTTTKTYTVTVTRAASASSDATLSNLIVNPGTLTPSFNPNTTNYTVNVANSVNSMTITAIANHAGASVTGDGNKSLNVGTNTFPITVTAENGTTTKTYTVTVTRATSSDATLSSLTVNPGTLSPSFNPNTTNYTVDVANNVTSIIITGTANHANATVTGNGSWPLEVGTNTFNIVVTAENSTTKTYTVAVIRQTSNTYYQITSSVIDGKGIIAPNGLIEVIQGGSQIYTMIPESGYKIAFVLVDGISVPEAAEQGLYTFENVIQNHTIGVLFQSTIGLDDLEEEAGIMLYPNPTSGELRIENYELKTGETIILYDLQGRKMLETDKLQIDLSDYPAGTYILNVGGKTLKVLKN